MTTFSSCENLVRLLKTRKVGMGVVYLCTLARWLIDSGNRLVFSSIFIAMINLSLNEKAHEI
ncbi:hypothetical protein CUMW_147560 [Citrus unshiu]|nr:hypothetical protein CUMW_147560 [Citrus unshiu]